MKTHKKCIVIMAVMTLVLSLLAGCHPVENDEQGQLGDLKNFTAYNKKGEAFTAEYFSDYDVTIVCFWAPWSDSAVYELRHLMKLTERLPENIGFVNVCLDSDLKESKERLNDISLKGFTNLREGDGDFKAMSDAIVNVPTTVLVDSKGNLMGDTIIGIQENYEKTYVKAVNKALKKLKKDQIRLLDPVEEATTEEEAATEDSKNDNKKDNTSEEDTEEENAEEDTSDEENTDEENTDEEEYSNEEDADYSDEE